jgi:hypothetical protein
LPHSRRDAYETNDRAPLKISKREAVGVLVADVLA